MKCELCGQGPRPRVGMAPEPVKLSTRNHHTCLMKEYLELKKAHEELLDRAHVYGVWGPWAEGWEGSYDQKHWGEE